MQISIISLFNTESRLLFYISFFLLKYRDLHIKKKMITCNTGKKPVHVEMYICENK